MYALFIVGALCSALSFRYACVCGCVSVGAVEACLQHGLRKRALGLFKNSTTTGLLQKVSKTYEPAAGLVKILSEMEKNMENARYTTYSLTFSSPVP